MRCACALAPAAQRAGRCSLPLLPPPPRPPPRFSEGAEVRPPRLQSFKERTQISRLTQELHFAREGMNAFKDRCRPDAEPGSETTSQPPSRERPAPTLDPISSRGARRGRGHRERRNGCSDGSPAGGASRPPPGRAPGDAGTATTAGDAAGATHPLAATVHGAGRSATRDGPWPRPSLA